MLYNNLKYGEHPRQILDLVLPDGVTGDMGLAFFIHGGGYMFGSKEEYSEWIQKSSAEHNIACAAMNYRYASEETGIDEIIEDITSALKTVLSFAAGKGVKLTRMMLNGASAGAHLSLLYAYKYKDISPIPPVAVVSFCGITDYTDGAFFGKNMVWYKEPDNWDMLNNLLSHCFKIKINERNFASFHDLLLQYSPIHYVDKNTVPAALFHGNQDTMVPYSNAVTLNKVLEAAGVPHNLVTAEGLNHDFLTEKEINKKAREELDAYILRYLK